MSFEDKWNDFSNSTRLLFPINKKWEHPSFAAIVDLGEEALPGIKSKLSDNHHELLYAVKLICPDSPDIPDEMSGKIEQMCQFYIRFLEQRGIN